MHAADIRRLVWNAKIAHETPSQWIKAEHGGILPVITTTLWEA
jgi:hypothetical protein